MASTSAVGLVQGHVSRPTHVARCWRGHECPYYARKCCWFLHDEDGEGSACAATARAAFPVPPASLLVRLSCLLEQVAEVLKVIQQRIVEPIVDEPVPLAEFVGVWEQIVDVPVPRTVEDDVGVVRSTPQERVQNRVLEQIAEFPVPQFLEERVQNRTLEQTVGSPVPQITEEIVERVQLVYDSPVLQIMEAIVENRFPELLDDVPVPQIAEAIVENRILEQTVGSPVPQLMEAVVEVVPQERVENRVLVQTVGSPVPQITEEIVESLQLVCDSPVPQIMEEIVEIRSPGQLVDVSVPQIMEAAVENRFPERIVNSPEPQFVENIAGEHVAASMPYTGKVFTVNLRHHREDQAFSDNVGILKGLDKHNMPRSGDIMVPPPQINKVSWFDRKPQAAADEPLYRFYQRYSGRSGRSKLKR